jgi:hypothetical protein
MILNHESSSLLSGDSRIIPEHTPIAATLSSNPNAAHTNQTDVRNFVAHKHQAVNTESSERALDDVPPRDTSRNNLATEITQANRKSGHSASSLHVPGADRTRLHPTSRPPGHRVPDLCDHPQSSALGLLLLPRSSSLHVKPHLPPAHHETSKCDSPNETKIKEKQNKTIPDSNSNLAKLMTRHNQTK